MNKPIYLCGDADCEGYGVCPCRDWKKIAADLDENAEKLYCQFIESGGERLAFKAIIKDLIRLNSALGAI